MTWAAEHWALVAIGAILTVALLSDLVVATAHWWRQRDESLIAFTLDAALPHSLDEALADVVATGKDASTCRGCGSSLTTNNGSQYAIGEDGLVMVNVALRCSDCHLVTRFGAPMNLWLAIHCALELDKSASVQDLHSLESVDGVQWDDDAA